MADIEDAHCELLIDWARKGDGEPLAELMNEMRDRGKPFPLMLHRFLCGVVAGKIKLNNPRAEHLTYEGRRKRHWEGKMIKRLVDEEMARRGKERDPALRKALMREMCERHGVKEEVATAFIEHPTRLFPAVAKPRKITRQ